jgi:hypothetical protein
MPSGLAKERPATVWRRRGSAGTAQAGTRPDFSPDRHAVRRFRIEEEKATQLFTIDRDKQQAVLTGEIQCGGLLYLIRGRKMDVTIGQIDGSALEFSAFARILP